MFSIEIPKMPQRSNSVCLSPVSCMIEKLKNNPKEFYNDSKVFENSK